MIECGFHGVEDSTIDPNEYGVDWKGPQFKDNDNTVVVDDPRNFLNQSQLTVLQSLVNPLEEDTGGYVVNVYNKTVRIVLQLLENRNKIL